MRAVRVYDGGAIDSLYVDAVPLPLPGVGEILVKVEATTVISSEIATREGVSTAALPLTLGNEFVGTVVEAPGGELPLGTRVVGGYGGYGYLRDGAWADYVLVDAVDAFPVVSTLSSVALAAIPASFTAASGSLAALGDVANKSLLIRGGTAGVGLALATLAKAQGATVLATTRNHAKRTALLQHGIDHVLIDGPGLIDEVFATVPAGADMAVDLLGLSSLNVTLRSVRPKGLVCMTGLLQDQESSIRTGIKEDRETHNFPHVLELIPPGVRLTTGGVISTPRDSAMVQNWVSGIENGTYSMPIDSVFRLESMRQAHSRRKAADAFGKVIIAVSEEAAASSPIPLS